MREFLKRLFCKHDYKWYRSQNTVTYNLKPVVVYYFECKKCGKVTTRIQDF